MKIPVRRSCISLIVLYALVEAVRADENETPTVVGRKGRVSGRIVKVYSGYKPDPILCTEEGFKADPVQCSMFYRCLKSSSGKFTVFKFQCGPGTVYDPETEVCNHPGSTKRSECGGKITHVEEELGNENDIDQHELPSPISTTVPVYMSTVHNTTYKVPSQSNLGEFAPSTGNGYMNHFLTTASSPYNLGLTTKVQKLNPWTDYKQTTQQKIITMTTIAPILGKHQLCTSDGFMGDSQNCKIFYRCVSNLRGGFIRYEFECSEPTVWDDHMQSCNHPWAIRSSRCGRAAINHENNTQISHLQDNLSTEKTDTSYGIKIPESTMQDSSSDEKQQFENYGDRLNNLNEYNVENNQVGYGSPINNYPIMSNNDKNTETVSNVHIDDTNNNYQFGEKITTQAPYSSNAENSFTQRPEIGKKFICTQNGFIGDSSDCKKFYRCVENGRGSFTKYEFSCSQGTVWDKNLEACNHAWAVKECGGTFEIDRFAPSSSTSLPIINQNDENGYIYPSHQEREPPTTIIVNTPVSLPSSSIHATSETTAPSSTTLKLPTTENQKVYNDNNEYNGVYGPQQDVAPNGEIEMQKTTSAPMTNQNNDCQSAGFIGDANDCKKFYRCVDNGQKGFIKHEFSCGEGTVWDPQIEACNHAWAVKQQQCGSNIPLRDEVTTSSNTYSSTNTQNFVVTSQPSSMQPSTSEEDINEYNSGYGQQQSLSTNKPFIDSESTTLKQTHVQTNKCKAAGFMGDMKNCNKFYRCVDNGNGHYIQYEFSCGQGTVWDPDIEACNHAWAVKHCGNSMTSTEKLPTSFTTSTTTSSSTTHVNKDDSNNEYVTNNADSHNTPSSFVESTKSTTSTTTLKSVTNPSNECVMSGFMGDNNNCKKFYRCVDNGNGGFIKYEFSCGEGTAWDTKIEACNHNWAVEKCGGNLHNEFIETTTHSIQPTNQSTRKPSSPVTESVTSTTNQATDSTTAKITTTTALNSSPTQTNIECDSEGYFANRNDCKKFYRCVDEGKEKYTKYDFSCAEGTAWDIKIQSCNYESEVEACQSNQHASSTTIESKPVHDEPITSSTTSPSTTSSTVSTSTTPTSTTTASTTAASTSSSVSTITTSTSSSSTASASTTVASPTTASTTAVSTTSSTENSKQNSCKEEGYFGDINDCKKFYRCVHENRGYTKYDFTCADGTIWDQDIITCNHPRDVKNPMCKAENVSSSSTTTAKSQISSTTNKPTSTSTTTAENNQTPSSTTSTKPTSRPSEMPAHKNDTNSNSNTTSTSENPNNNNVTCTKAGFFANPSNCKKFYRCVDWENNGQKFSIYHFECGDGTIWDPALETCNHEESVYPPRKCSSAQQQAENTSTTSSTTEQITSTTSTPTKSTTQSSTTNESSTQTTQLSTTGNPTTQALTTEPSTTKESTTQTTTEQSTTHSSTTGKPTTQSTTTEESTTQSSTTQSSTTEESTTQTTTSQSTTTDTSTTQSSSTEESTTQSTTTDKSTTQPSTTEESTTQTSTTQSTTTDKSTTQSSTTEESTTQTSTTQSTTTDESTTQSSTTGETTTQTSTTGESTTQSSSTDSQETTTTTQMTTSTDQTSTTTENSSESTTESSTTKECPDTANNQSLYVCPTSFKRHPKYCNLFYQCTEDNDSHELKIAVFNCPNNTIYDESKIQCVPENKSSKKCNGKISQNHRVKRLTASQNAPFEVTKESMACQNSGHFPFEKDTDCSEALLKCESTDSGLLQGIVYRCPDGYVYWNISRRCEPIRKVRDCKRSSYPWKRRYDIPLERYNISP